MMLRWIPTISAAVALLAGVPALAAQGYILCKNGSAACANGQTYTNGNPLNNVSEWCTCKTLSSTCTSDTFVPTNTRTEWTNFISNKPACVTVSTCGTDPNIISSPTTPVNVPSNCGHVDIVAKGGGGAGGEHTTSGSKAGGAGGQVDTGVIVVNGPYTYTLGLGGKAGKCDATGGATRPWTRSTSAP